MNLDQFKAWYPTLVQYVGLTLAVALVAAGIAGVDGTSLAPGATIALGMILYKPVKGLAKDE